MFDVGFQELTLIGVIALIVVGPERLPRMARTLGLWMGKIRYYVGQVKSDIEREVRAQELKEMLNKPADELDDLYKVAEETKGTLDQAKGALGEAKAALEGPPPASRHPTSPPRGPSSRPSFQVSDRRRKPRSRQNRRRHLPRLPRNRSRRRRFRRRRPRRNWMGRNPVGRMRPPLQRTPAKAMSDRAKESEPEDSSESQAEMTFVEHLVELRNRLLRVVLVVAVLLLCLMPFANRLYAVLAAPLLAEMHMGGSMIATQVASPFLTPFKLALVAAILIGMPYILYQFWAFVAPGLYRNEKRLVFPLMVSSSFLFYLGMAFAYFVVFPLMFAFFQAVAPEGVEIMTDISSYLDFVLKIFFAFGLAFEVPIATVVLVWTGFTTPESLVQKRPYIIVGAFVVGMLLTPPDMISQTLLALPVWVLFELGVVFARVYVRRDADADTSDAGAS